MSGVESVPAADWEAWVTENEGLVLDVREPTEWDLGTLPGSVLISLGQIMERAGELDKGRAVLCVCRSGARSGQVAMYLSATGFQQVANLTGGVKALGMQD